MKKLLTSGCAAAVAVGSVLVAPMPAALAGSSTVTTPHGSLRMTIDGGAFTEECTDFPYEVTVTGASDDIQWSAEIEAVRDGGGSTSGMITDYGSGDFTDDMMICSGDGAGDWTATVTVRTSDTGGSTRVYEESMTIDFTISKAKTVTTITSVTVGSSKTKIKGTVLDLAGGSATTAFGDVTIKTKRAGGGSRVPWLTRGTVQVDEDGRWSLTLDRTFPTGVLFIAVFAGTPEAKRSSSASYPL